MYFHQLCRHLSFRNDGSPARPKVVYPICDSAIGVGIVNLCQRSASSVPIVEGVRIVEEHSTAAIAAHIGRYDSSAVFSAIRVIAQAQASPAQYSGDPALQALLETMKHLGVIFLGFESGRLFYASNGTGKKSVPVKRLVDFLAQARQQRVL
jgi:hypothetical protein